MFNKEQKLKSEFVLGNANAKLSSLNSNDIRKLAVAWSYYSGKIEGNTYTYVETESLLLDGVTSPKRYEDARMLKNLHNTFNSIVAEIHAGHRRKIDEASVFSLHSSLIADLVDVSQKGTLRNRPVQITGTSYLPPKSPQEISLGLNEVFFSLVTAPNPLEKAIYVHCNLARIQPFIDGNKRTARLIESIVLMQADLIPIFSTRDEDILKYRNSLLAFYETKDYSPYANYFLDNLLERIHDASLDS